MEIQQAAIVQPIIIKRRRVVKADGHHGGAWKVAYADFVTAMMAAQRHDGRTAQGPR
jgi:chemotaxis protein MotB